MTPNRNIYPITLESEIDSLRQATALSNAFTSYNEICAYICDANEAYHNNNYMSHVVKDITHYLESNYMNQNLSLDMIAEMFNFAPSYLSRVYKEYTGVSFTSCLRTIRIQAACNYLQTSDNIEAISQMAGYYSANSFRVAFKSIMGTTPSQYRRRKKQEVLSKDIKLNMS